MISCISDVHIRKPGDSAEKLLQSFFSHPLVQKSHTLILLGDIFDLMCGPHDAYLSRYADYFEQLKEFVLARKRVYIFEGNHDVHLGKLYKKFLKSFHYTNSETLTVVKKDLALDWKGKKILFSHGDTWETGNKGYKRYKNFITSYPLTFIGNNCMPLSVLEFFGERASRRSRQNNLDMSSELRTDIRDRVREGLALIRDVDRYDYIVGGHTHIKDVYRFSSKEKSITYFNGGFPLQDQCFLCLRENEFEFISF